MDGLLRDGVDLQALSGGSLIGDSYFFEETTTPGKIREYLDSFKVRSSRHRYLLQVIGFLCKGPG